MSLDPSLKSASSLTRHRNVLTRAERLDQLKEQEKWTEGKSPFGLPKVGHRKAAIVKAEKVATEEGVAGAAAPAAGAKAAAPAAAGAKGAAPAAAGAKGAAPAAGAKGAAPAAKAAAPAAKKK
jgi:small basic protein (TIGR04137 family)